MCAHDEGVRRHMAYPNTHNIVNPHAFSQQPTSTWIPLHLNPLHLGPPTPTLKNACTHRADPSLMESALAPSAPNHQFPGLFPSPICLIRGAPTSHPSILPLDPPRPDSRPVWSLSHVHLSSRIRGAPPVPVLLARCVAALDRIQHQEGAPVQATWG
jgi:hypothetical protein